MKILCLVVGVFLAGEALLRSRAKIRFGEAKSSYYVPHRVLGHILKPNFTTSGTRGTLHINSLGFRGDEFSDLPKKGVIRIACIGSSPVFGGTIDDDLVFPAVLQKLLKENQSKFPVEVINAGAPGWGANQVLYHLEHYVLPHKPVIAIIYPPVNDIGVVMRQSETVAKGSPQQPHFLQRWRREHSVFYNTFRDELSVLNPERAGEQFTHFPERDTIPRFEAMYTKLVQACKDNHIIPVLCTQARAYRRDQPLSVQRKYASGWGLGLEGSYEGDEALNKAVAGVAKKQDIVLVGLAKLIPGGEGHFIDSIHFSPQGHVKVAKALANALLANKLFESVAFEGQ